MRDRRQAETSRALKAEARRLTAERGFTGFTIEELCSEVGVSRRTFFNYFASKENAVLGVGVRTDSADLDDRFRSAQGPLVTDLAELHIARWELMSLSKDEGAELARVFEREPRLFAHFVGLAAQGEREDISLTMQRADVASETRAETAVQLLGALIRPSALEYFADDGAEFRTIFLRRLDEAFALFSR